MTYLLPPLAADDVCDLHARQILTMSTLAMRVLAPLFLEGDDFLRPPLSDDLTRDRGALKGRCADLGARHQDLTEGDRRAGLAGEQLDIEHIALGHLVLLSARADDREHRFYPEITRMPH